MKISRRLPAWAFVLLSPCAAAQQAPPDRIDWVAALADRFDHLENPVTAIYGKTSLGSLVCSEHKAAGAKLLRDAWAQLQSLPDDAFDHSKTKLPVSTLKALRKIVAPDIRECDKSDQWDDRAIEERVQREWREKPDAWLRTALETADPDRTAQLVQAALSVGFRGFGMVLTGKRSPDLSLLDRVLRQLALTAPDLADDLFENATNWPTSHDANGPGEIELMAKYLFPTSLSVVVDIDPPFANEVYSVSDPPRLPNFMHAQLKGSTDVAERFLSTTVRILENFHPISADPVGAYSLAYQMLPKAKQYAPQYVGAIESALRNMETIPAARAEGVRKKFGAPPSTESALESVSEILSDIRGDRLASAYRRLSSINDEAMRHQLEALVSFREAAHSIDKSNQNRIAEHPIYPEPGVKRVLLNASIAAMDGDRDVAARTFHLALTETESLPSSQQACLYSQLVGAAQQMSKDEFPGVLQSLVRARNANFGQPSKATETIRCGVAGPEELVNTPTSLQRVSLTVEGISNHTISELLEKAPPADYARLEPIVLELQDETELTQALLALAKLRLTSSASK